jgi:hypothetical protein
MIQSKMIQSMNIGRSHITDHTRLFYYLYNEVAFLALSKVAPVTHAVGNTIKRVVVSTSPSQHSTAFLRLTRKPLPYDHHTGSLSSFAPVMSMSGARWTPFFK